MSERTKKFSLELSNVITEGESLLMAMQNDCHPAEFKKEIINLFGDENKAEVYIEKLPNFKAAYQAWYSKSQAVVKQVLPDRLADFRSYYEYPKLRKEISFNNYMIRDYLQGLEIRNYDGRVKVGGDAAIPEFVQQMNIIRAAQDVLESILMDLKAVLQADLFDSELEAAGALAKAGYLRASGAICGVVIEKHLSQVAATRVVKIVKKNPTIADLTQSLRLEGIITLAQERFIQSLADTRNVCTHAKGRESTKDEIAALLDGTDKVLKTVF